MGTTDGIAVLCGPGPFEFHTPYFSTSGQTPGNIYTVDLNNDGITDILQDTEGESRIFKPRKTGVASMGGLAVISNVNGRHATLNADFAYISGRP